MKKYCWFFLLLVSTSSLSAGQWCHGKVERVYVDKSGSVYIFGNWRQDYTQICNVNSPWKGVSLELCKTWFSLAVTAKVSAGNVIVQYGDVAACNSIPHYSNAPSPNYVMLNI